MRIAVQDNDSRIAENGFYLVHLAGLVVVIPQHRDDGRRLGRAHFLDEYPRLLGEPVVGQVSAQGEDIRGGGHGPEQRLEDSLGALLAMDVTDCGHPHRPLLSGGRSRRSSARRPPWSIVRGV